MNKKRFRTGIDFINVLLPLLVIYSLLICFLYYQYGEPSVVLYTIAFMTVPIIFFITYEAVDNFFFFVIIHLLVVGVVFYIAPDLLYRLLFGILSIIFALISYYKKNDVVLPKPSSIGFMPTLVMIIMFFVANKYDTILISALITLAFIMYVLLCMYNKYLVNTYIFCDTTNATDIKSFSKSQKTFKKMWRILILSSAIIMALFSLIPSLGFIHYLKVFLISLCRLILSPLGNPDPDFLKMNEPEPAMQTPVPNDAVGETISQTSDSHFSVIPIYIIFGIAFVFVVISLIRALFADDIASLDRTNESEDEVSFIHREKKKDVKKPKKFASLFGSSNEQKIRKIFYKTITDNIDERLNVRGSLTPSQLCDITYEEVDKDTLHAMKDIYVQARYSDEPSSHADLAQMKELSKKCQKDVKESYSKYDKLDGYHYDKDNK